MTDDHRAFDGDLSAWGLPTRTRAWVTVDKAGWRNGPWHAEPDRVQWTDRVSRLPCLIARHRDRGHLCGYVAVPPGHTLHGADKERVPALAPGSVTFTGPQPGSGPPVEPTNIPPCELNDPWWIGFDASHGWDVCPGETDMWDLLGVVDGGVIPGPDGPIAEYRPIDYMVNGCVLLAAQLAGQLTLVQGHSPQEPNPHRVGDGSELPRGVPGELQECLREGESGEVLAVLGGRLLKEAAAVGGEPGVIGELVGELGGGHSSCPLPV